MFAKTVTVAACLMILAAPATALAGSDRELPQAAKPGECYARVFVPSTHSTTTEQVLSSEASERIEVTPARYETVTQQVLVKEASEKLEVVPAQYGWQEEKVLVTPAQTTWKKGSGPIERVDNATGEIMCLVEEPGVYKTVRQRLLKSPATTRKVTIPAVYTNVTVQKMVSPPQERRVEIPAKYDTVTKRSMTSDGAVEWKPVLCQTNMSGTNISAIQRTLKTAGFDPGTIDGRMGPVTLSALRAFQKSKGLAVGELTMETMDALNGRVGG